MNKYEITCEEWVESCSSAGGFRGMIESQKLHVLQCKEKAIATHKKHMNELNSWIKCLDEELKKYS